LGNSEQRVELANPMFGDPDDLPDTGIHVGHRVMHHLHVPAEAGRDRRQVPGQPGQFAQQRHDVALGPTDRRAHIGPGAAGHERQWDGAHNHNAAGENQ
jgi:hypothetical protein